MEHDFADELRGPDPTKRTTTILLAIFAGLFIGLVFAGFAWAGA